MKYSLFALTVGVCAGVFLQNSFSYATELVVALVIIFCAEIFIFRYSNSKTLDPSLHWDDDSKYSDDKNEKSLISQTWDNIIFHIGVLFLISGMILGIVRAQFISEKEIIFPQGKIMVSGVVNNEPVILENIQRVNLLTAESFSGEKNVSLLVTLPLYPKVSIGENLSLDGAIENPEIIFPTPPVSMRSFDYKKYLSLQNIYGAMIYPKIISHQQTTLLWWQKIQKIKTALSEKLSYVIPSPESKLAGGILFGEDTLPKEIKNNFVMSGVSHVIVLSGYNITIFIIFVMMIFLFVPFDYRLALASITTILFVIAVGGGASVIRATLMSLVSLLAMYAGREYDAKRALFFSAFLITMYDPKILLYDVSFHLSFFATFGIIFFNKPFVNYFKRYINNKILLETFCVTLSAYLITLPYIVATFGKISIYAILVNILIVPFVPVAMMFSFLASVFGYISSIIATMFGYIAYVILKFIIGVVSIMSSLPFAQVNTFISYSSMCEIYIIGAIIYFYYLFKMKTETCVTNINIIKNNNEVVDAIVKY